MKTSFPVSFPSGNIKFPVSFSFMGPLQKMYVVGLIFCNLGLRMVPTRRKPFPIPVQIVSLEI
jgi:hypothetical protein